MDLMMLRIRYHDTETAEDTQRCPPGPVFIESVWLSTLIEDNEEVRLIVVDYRDFKYA